MSDTETDEWTPSTEQVRSHYVFNQSNQWDGERGEAFDRWLAAHDAEVRAGVVAAEPEWEWEYGERSRYDADTVWIVPEGRTDIWDETPPERRVRRRPASEWEVVPDTTNHESEGKA